MTQVLTPYLDANGNPLTVADIHRMAKDLGLKPWTFGPHTSNPQLWTAWADRVTTIANFSSRMDPEDLADAKRDADAYSGSPLAAAQPVAATNGTLIEFLRRP
ncbi:hypothetical protein V5F50_19885 [Xanthobacter sp. V13C-7B]|uniref:hypothetical protein n=1 Tax=Xanthobacter variabilis TaxID=3119932 RepID=UPI00372BBB70